MLQTVGKYNTDKAKMVENEKSAIDWEHFENAIDDPIVGEMKACYDKAMKDAEAGPIADYEKDQQKLVAQTKDIFEGLVRPDPPPPRPTADQRTFLGTPAALHIRPRRACRSSLRAGRRRPRARRGWSRPSRT